MIATLDEVMDAAAAAITGAPITGGAISGAEISEAGPVGPVTGALKVGVDFGTAYTVVVALDADDRPLAGAAEFADVVRDGVVVDFLGALDLLTRLKARVEARLGRALTSAHGAYPPGIPEDDARAVRHVIEAAGMECSGLVDEPSAANAVLGLRDGVVVDVGGGTTGIALVDAFHSGGKGELSNISTRSKVLVGDEVLIGGFITQSGPMKAIVRGLGRSLEASGVLGSLQNPRLRLFSGQTVIASNDDWETGNCRTEAPQALWPKDAREACMVIELPPGPYTTIIDGVSATTGVSLVEVFNAGD